MAQAQAPAQMQLAPSGSEVSKVESDIAQTITLADTIVTLIKEPATLIYQNIVKAQQLRRSLGCWHEEALDGNKQYRIPVLLRENFEDHVVKTDGLISAGTPASTPGTENENNGAGFRAIFRLSMGSNRSLPRSPKLDTPPIAAGGCWTYLLHVMRICPGMGTLDWKPSTDGFINTQNGGIEMEVEGSVLCHIINMYSTTLDSNPWARRWPETFPDRRTNKSCKFRFGKLAWESSEGQVHAHFEPGPETELGGEHVPFGKVGTLMEPGTLIVSYLTALEHGVSDPDLRLADSTAPLQERIEVFLRCFTRLHEHQNPLLISYDWFEEAARIKRRVLAQGGDDFSFYDDICVAIDEEPRIPSEREKTTMKDEVRRLFLFDKETFTFWVTGMGSLSSNPRALTPSTFARNTLEGYQSELVGSWKRELYESREQVLRVLHTSNKVFIGRKTWLLEFTNACSLWNGSVLLGAPINR